MKALCYFDGHLSKLQQPAFMRKRDLYVIPCNVASGAYIVERYLSRTNNIEKALHEYVGGDPYYAGKVLQALGEIYLARSFRNE